VISDLYPVALDNGMSSAQFWDSTMGEIMDYIESRYRQDKQKLKEKILLYYALADRIGLYVAKVVGDSNNEIEIPQPWVAFPDLFMDEKTAAEEKKRQHEMELYKAKMIDYALRHNNLCKKD